MNNVLSASKAIIVNQKKILMIKFGIGEREIWDLPGGKIQYGETPIETLHREVKEELCMEVKILKYLGVWWFFRIKDNDQVICTSFLCKPKSLDMITSLNPSKGENITEYKWLPIEQILSDTLNVSDNSLKELFKENSQAF